jgi:hypothetical protein
MDPALKLQPRPWSIRFSLPMPLSTVYLSVTRSILSWKTFWLAGNHYAGIFGESQQRRCGEVPERKVGLCRVVVLNPTG